MASRMKVILFIILLCSGIPGDTLITNFHHHLNFTETSHIHGYKSEEHTIVTRDGYILTAFRIFKKNCVLRSPPVLLMHGLLQSADAWLDPGPSAGLPFLLADNCFDVWVGNQRGNYYARRHKTLNPDKQAAFWNFGVDEIGFHDIPATIDYILQHSRVSKLNYVGFSQGSATLLIMCSERPGYCDKANIHIGLAPASRHTNTRTATLKSFTNELMRFQGILSSVGYNEVLAKGAVGQEILSFTCHLRLSSEKLCQTAESLFDSFHPGSITNETLHNIFGHFPAGTSLKVLVRYAQSFISSRFEKYNYGSANSKVYGTKRPPSFNLSAVTVPNVIMFGRNDHIVDPNDVLWLVKRLPNVLESVEIRDPLWNHFDCIYSRHISKVIYPTVNKYLLRYSNSFS